MTGNRAGEGGAGTADRCGDCDGPLGYVAPDDDTVWLCAACAERWEVEVPHAIEAD